MCGSKPGTVTYMQDGKQRTITKNKLDNLSKWTSGALARRRFKKIVLTRQIQGKLID